MPATHVLASCSFRIEPSVRRVPQRRLLEQQWSSRCHSQGAGHPVRRCKGALQPRSAAGTSDAAPESSAQLRSESAEAVPGDASAYYQQYQQSLPSYPLYPPATPQRASSNLPAFIWVGVGILIAVAYQKITSIFAGGPQATQQRAVNWAMKAMMENAMKGQGAPGGSPFGGLGGMGSMSDMSGPNRGFPPGGFPGLGGSSSPAFDTTANPVGGPAPPSPAPQAPAEPAAATSAGSNERPGSRFEELKAREQGRPRTERAAAAPAAQATTQAPPRKASFSQVEEEEASTSTSGNGAANTSQGSGKAVADDTMDQFLRDPAMQQLLYKYLPESMRNPESFNAMVSNPEFRAQLMQQGYNMNPEMMRVMSTVDTGDVKKHLGDLGLTPEQVVERIMEEPELANAFSKPRVMQAIIDSQSDPMNILKYQDDPDVMLVFEKMAKMFPNMAAPMPGSPQ